MAEVQEKKIKFCDKSYDLDELEAEFAFGNGTTLTLKKSDVSAETWDRLALHGAGQKVGDSFAGAAGDFAVGIASAQGVIDQLRAGQWTAARGEGEGKPRMGELIEALARVKGMTTEEVTNKLAAKSEEEIKNLRKAPAVALAISEIKTEKLKAKLAGSAADVKLD